MTSDVGYEIDDGAAMKVRGLVRERLEKHDMRCTSVINLA
jgi:hypothetical protein